MNLPFFKKSVISVLTFALSFTLAIPGAFAASTSPNNSAMGATKDSVTADGIESVQITVLIRDDLLAAQAGIPVELFSSRGALDEISPSSTVVTDSLGRAKFDVRSLRDGLATFTAQANGLPLEKWVDVTFKNGLSFPLAAGDLIKIPDDGNATTLNDTAVYYYATDGRRYVFPNENTYFTWYTDFSNVQVIPIDQMSLIPIGGNITYRPGTRMVKFQTDPKTYIIIRGGVLRWIKSEDIARTWFGPAWNTFVDDVSEAFYVNYTFGVPVENALDVSLQIIRDATRTVNADKGFGNP